jgi:choline dehydrogenase-like flavoprotein
VVSDPPGRHVLTLPAAERKRAQELSQGLDQQPTSPSAGAENRTTVARPGTYLLRGATGSNGDPGGMPAAALSSNVGGMGAHWTCACPGPYQSERIDCIAPADMDGAIRRARDLLGVRTDGFAASPLRAEVERRLGKVFNDGRPPERDVQPMPLACEPTASGRPRWLGPAKILCGAPARPAIRPSTLCRRIIASSDEVLGAELVDVPTRRSTYVRAGAVVVAGDALRSPQLLWASGIRPEALGRYLNDQPQTVADVRLSSGFASSGQAAGQVADIRDALSGVTWVPYCEPDHPFHGQVLDFAASPIVLGDRSGDGTPGVILSWFAAKDLQSEDRVVLSDSRTDAYGMPRISLVYSLTERDMSKAARAAEAVGRAAAVLGEYRENAEPRLLPAGSSLHYQGTVRLGATDDGTSVCDRDSRVWGYQNLFVAGNGVIPTSTACNPTLTAAALAVLSARACAASL